MIRASVMVFSICPNPAPIRTPGTPSWGDLGIEKLGAELLERVVFNTPSDPWQLIPPALPDPFESSHLASVLGHSRWFAQKIAYCLRQSGVISQSGKKAIRFVYSRLLSRPEPDRETTALRVRWFQPPMMSHPITSTNASPLSGLPRSSIYDQ